VGNIIPLSFFSFLASLIRGNRANCALFCDNLDWLVSKLDRLEASSGRKPSFIIIIYHLRVPFDQFNVLTE